MLLLSILLLGTAIHLSDEANILVCSPMIGQSHIQFVGNIADVLSRRGHNVTVLSIEIDPLLRPFGIKEKNIHKVHLATDSNPEVFRRLHNDINNVWTDKDMKAIDAEDFDMFFNPLVEAYQVILNNTDLLRSMRDSKFDIAIHEYYEIGSAALMEAFGVTKTISASAIGDLAPYTYDVTGIPFLSSFVPVWATNHKDEMSFWERAYNLYKYYEVRKMMNRMEKKVEILFQSHNVHIPNFRNLISTKTGMIFANVNEFTQTPRPTSSMIQFVGGSHLYPPKPLKKEFDELLNKRKYNVLFSLGSFVRLCEAPIQIKRLFAEAFASMDDVTFLVKYENCSKKDFDYNLYDNIVTENWMPQTDLLGDERINVFITHGGMNSITEGQFRGKPMIVIPIFGDQILNSKNAERVGSSILIDRRFITKELLVESLRRLLDPKDSHVKRAKFVQKSLEGREEEYRQKIVKWVELQAEAEKPFDHLILHSRNLSMIELYNLDILAMVLSIFSVFLVIFIILAVNANYFIKKLFGKTKTE